MRSATRVTVTYSLLAFFILASLATLPLRAYGLSDEHASPTVPERQVNNVFDIANGEYKAGNVEDAARLYEGLVSGPGLKTADIYYNLGNAYYKLHKYGKAIASYQRSLQMTPREQDALANLRYVRGLTRDKIDRPKSTEMLHELFFFHYELNSTESELIFLGAYFAAILFATAYLFRKVRSLKWLTVAALILALTFGASTFMHFYQTENPVDGVVTVEEASIHTGPGDSYILSFNLHDGAELEVRERAEGWYQVELPDGRRGWVKESQVELI